MSLLQQQGIPAQMNGERVISIIRGKDHYNSATFQGMIDRNELLFDEDHRRYHLGLITSFGMQGKESFANILELLKTGGELTVNGFFGSFTFDKPFYDLKKGFRTIASTEDEAGDYPGIEESEFDIILSEKCYPGDILATDPYGDSPQLIVNNCESSVLNGEGWRTTVTLTSGNKEDIYPVSLLANDIKYYKIDHAFAEYDSQFTGVDLPSGAPTGAIRAEFKLGNVRGVEGYVSGFADAVKGGFATVDSRDKECMESIRAFQREFAQGDERANTVIFGEVGDTPNMRATSIMEYLVERTLAKRTATSHMWLKPGMIKSKNGAVTYLNEGMWHSFRRGKRIEIPRYMGITRAHIAEAVRYVFRNKPQMRWEDRKIHFKVGKLAEENFLILFQDEVKSQLELMQQTGVLSLMLGDRGALPRDMNIVTGSSLTNLELHLLKFTKVPLVGIAGEVTIEHDPSLDYLSGNPIEYRGQYRDGLDWTSHTAIIFDVTESYYSNNDYNIKDAEQTGGDKYITKNRYLVRPEDGMTFKGQENGRWDRGKTSGIISSSKVIAQGFWAFNSSAVWTPRPEDVVMIELTESARKNGQNLNSFR